MATSLVVTVIGSDRPGIVSSLSDVARRFGASWTGSRMATLAGQFAGMVHFEVADENSEPLAAALRGLVSSGLQIVIARGESGAATGGQHKVRLELVGNDRPGIVRDLSTSLARRGVSIEELHTEVVSAAMSADPLFKVQALLAMPATLRAEDLKQDLETLANEMMVDIDLAEATGDAAPSRS